MNIYRQQIKGINPAHARRGVDDTALEQIFKRPR